MSRLWPLTCLVCVCCVAGCDRPLGLDVPSITGRKISDQEAIAVVLDDVHRGLQTSRIYKVMAHLSPRYHDECGRDRQAVQAYLNDFFKRYRDIWIMRVRPEIALMGERARVIETFGATAEPVNRDVDAPINSQGQVMIYLEKVGGDWKIVEWREVR